MSRWYAPEDAARYGVMLREFRACESRRAFDHQLIVFFADRTYPRLDLQEACVVVLREKGWPDAGGEQ